MPQEQRDLVIIGAGPAGLTAGLYAARARLDAVLLEKLSPGGQVLNTHWVDNWPGDVEGISGFDLSDRLRDHALRFDLEIRSQEVTGFSTDGAWKVLQTPDGEIRAKAVIICSGAQPSKLGVPGEEKLGGKGVSYCGTCDGPFFRDQVVVCFGGGNTAVEEANYLTRFASKVYLAHRRDELRAVGVECEKLLSNEKVEMLWSHVPVSIEGEDKVESVKLKNLKTDQEVDIKADGAFVFVGIKPTTEFLGTVLNMDPAGFIKVDQNQQTSLPGVFAAGDCCCKMLRQIVVSAGEGAVAEYAAQHYLENFKE